MSSEGADVFYVCKKMLETIKEKLKKNETVTDEEVQTLTDAEGLPDDEIMIPVDMRGVEGDFEDVSEMIEKLKAKGTGEAFVKAREYFEKNEDKEPEADRPQEMPASEWREMLNVPEGEEEEFPFMEGEEEELNFMEGEEEAPEEDAEEPAAKKAKTD